MEETSLSCAAEDSLPICHDLFSITAKAKLAKMIYTWINNNMNCGDFGKENKNYYYDDYMIQLRVKLEVANDISNELMLENIEQFTVY